MPPQASSQLLQWVAGELGQCTSALTAQLIAGDASPRRYYRVHAVDAVNARLLEDEAGAATLVAVESPATEKNPEFLAMRALLERAGIRVPGLIASDLEQGYLLLEDLGDELLLPRLTLATVDDWYTRSLKVSAHIAALPSIDANVPPYDKDFLQLELDICPEWFFQRLLGVEWGRAEQRLFQNFSDTLIASATEQPQVVVHRDFHSRNLMVLPDSELAVIDFQGALVGPITYDPVSLLKDCYITWPRARQLTWLEAHRRRLIDQGVMTDIDAATFTRWFDLMGLQRHIKVLGIFARLALRDDKPAYLSDLPVVLAYVIEALALYAAHHVDVAAFYDWLLAEVLPRARQQAWWHEATVFGQA